MLVFFDFKNYVFILLTFKTGTHKTIINYQSTIFFKDVPSRDGENCWPN